MKHLLTLFMLWLLSFGIVACANQPNTSESSLTPTPTTHSQPTAALHTAPKVVAIPPMREGRAAHTATLLPNNKVLITGGFADGEQALDTAEIFDPGTNSFATSSPMSEARQSHTATLLPDGKVLLAGGFNADALDSAEIYDPATGLFTPTGPLVMARSGHKAILLDSGKVLLMGGTGKGWTFLATAELYDPASGTFTAAANMTTPRESHTATRLNNGTVLITGGHQGRRADITIYNSAELYDPTSGTFTPTGVMTVKRHKHDATLLADGRVFISGGADERDAQGAYRSTEIYDPQTGSFAPAGMMQNARYKHTETSLLTPNGQVLLIGGANTTELYDPPSETFQTIAAGIGVTRLFATATRLTDGSILFAGGYGTNTTSDPQSWLLTP